MQSEEIKAQYKNLSGGERLAAFIDFVKQSQTSDKKMVRFSAAAFGNKRADGGGDYQKFNGKEYTLLTVHVNNGSIENLIKMGLEWGLRIDSKLETFEIKQVDNSVSELKPSVVTTSNSEKIVTGVKCEITVYDLQGGLADAVLLKYSDGSSFNLAKTVKGDVNMIIKAGLTDAKKRAFYVFGLLGNLRDLPKIFCETSQMGLLSRYLQEVAEIAIQNCADDDDDDTFNWSKDDKLALTVRNENNQNFAILQFYKKGNDKDPYKFGGNDYIKKWELPVEEQSKVEEKQKVEEQKFVDSAITAQIITAFKDQKTQSTFISECILHPDKVSFYRKKNGQLLRYISSADSNQTFDYILEHVKAAVK